MYCRGADVIVLDDIGIGVFCDPVEGVLNGRDKLDRQFDGPLFFVVNGRILKFPRGHAAKSDDMPLFDPGEHGGVHFIP
jgi:hypothetical protein